MQQHDQDPPVDVLWERAGRLWTCRLVLASGLVSASSCPLEPESVRGFGIPLKPGHGIFRVPGDPTTLLVVGDVEVSSFCDAAKPRPQDEQVVDSMYNPDWMGCVIIGVSLIIPDTSSWYHVRTLFLPNINAQSLEAAHGAK